MLKIKFILSLIVATLFLSLYVFGNIAEDITQSISITTENISINKITDNSISTHSYGENVMISYDGEIPLEGIYIKFNKAPQEGLLNEIEKVSSNGFLHEYIPLNSAVSFNLFYPQTDICDIQIFSSGTLPESVQLWQSGEAETDILLCATHSDDDQLFFAGLLPYYAGYKNLRVRVAYFVNHYDTYNRTHELLDGLWHCGVKLYPDISKFPDGYSESIDGAKYFLESKGFSYNDVLEYQRNLLNKYRPLIVVLHDFDGEYGHGAHMLNTASFIEVCSNTTDEQYLPEKIYVHLYGENKIKLNIDTPLDVFNGKSAFNVSQQAFGYHKSQHWTWFYKWIYGSNNNLLTSSQIRSYNPAEYGLYFSSVGADTGTNELTENVITYDVRAEISKLEEQKRLEEQKLAEQLQKQKEQEENSQIEYENNNETTAENSIDHRPIIFMVVIAALIIVILAVLFVRILLKG